MPYRTILRLFNDSDELPFQIDNGVNPTNTDLSTAKTYFNFNKYLLSPDFHNSAGTQLSFLDGFNVSNNDVKLYIDSLKLSGDSLLVVNPNLSASQEALFNKYFTSISSALTYVSDNSLTDVSILLFPGTYNESISIGDSTVCIFGMGNKDDIIISNTLSSDIITTNYTNSNTYNLNITGVTFQTCKYAITSTNIKNINIDNCVFKNCGWNSTEPTNENQTGYENLQLSTHTSAGGCVSITNATEIIIKNCEFSTSNKGIHLIDVLSGFISNSLFEHNLDLSLHLNSSTGDGSTGCENIVVSGCKFDQNRSGSVKITGGIGNNIVECSINKSYGPAVFIEHTGDINVSGCTFYKNNLKSYIGTGAASNLGTFMIKGSTNINSDSSYFLNASGNSFSCGGQGTEATAYAIYAADTGGREVNVSGSGFVCFPRTTGRVNDNSLVTDEALNYLSSLLHNS